MKKIYLMLVLLCAMGQGVWAQNFDVWDGVSEEKPGYYRTGSYSICLQIRSAAQMAWVMNHFTSTYAYWNDWLGRTSYTDARASSIEICTNIDMTARNWKPMGRYTGDASRVFYNPNPWTGGVTFNGLGHTIKIKIDDAEENCQSLFYGIGERATVTNLHLDCYIKVGNYRMVAGIAAENNGIIENCWVSGHIESDHYSAHDAELGAIAGLNNNDGIIRYCCVTADVKNTDGNFGVGGIAGSNEGTIQHVTLYGSVSVDHDQDNKWVGDQDGTLNNNYDSFQESEMSVGGDMYHRAIKYPYAINITTVGNGTYRADIGSDTNVSGCYPYGTVTLTNTSGRNLHSISIKDANDNDIDSYGDMNTTLNITMQKKDIYVTAVFSANWPIGGHTGEAEDPYIISSVDDWNEFAHSVYLGNTHNGKHVKLTKDISVTKMIGSCNGASDTDYKPFSGTFDGDGHTLTINLSNQSRFGAPFKCVEGATIKNLHTAGKIDGSGNESGKLLSGLVGISFGNTTITGCRSSVTLTTDFGARGYEDAALAGFVAGTVGGSLTVSGCVFDGSMTGTDNKRCAGISGYEYSDIGKGSTTTSISNCLFAPKTLTVSTTDDGYTKTITRDADATITNCHYTQVLGTAQGSDAIFSTYAPSTCGSMVQDYGMVKAYENCLFYDGKYYYAPSTSAGTGTKGDPYIISSDGQWDTFVYNVNNNINNYSGEYILLAADISVTTMMGSNETNSFQGTLLGNNHTLTFTKGSSESPFNEQYCAPFRFTKNAAIQDLKVAGDIYTSQKYAAGLVSRPYGTTSITNCHVSTDIYSNVNGDGTHGGIVAMPAGAITIEGSTYTGRLLTNSGTNYCGGFVGWHNSATITVTNSLYAPNGSIPSGWTVINNGATFVRGGNAGTHCYYTETLGNAQGKQTSDFTTAPAHLASLEQEYGMLKVYENGILFDGTYYVAITLSGAGTETNPYIIDDASQWNDFANYVTNNYNFIGKFVKLNADIEVSTMAGADNAKSFQGTFDGDSHTLTFNMGTAESPFNEQYCAPFRHVKNASIKNLHVAGTIYTCAQKAAGIVGESHGALNLNNCRSSVAINSSKSGDGTHGGLVSTLSGAGNTIIIDGCVFDGSFATTNSTKNCGGFIGWPVYNRPIISNSLMKPGSVDASMLNNTFARWHDGYEPTITNCYFVTTTNLPANQGAQAETFIAAPANLGSLKVEYSMMKVYVNGLLYDGTYYMIPTITLENHADNSTTISSNNSMVFDVTLADRTLYKDGKWNTLCLPFDVTLVGSPLAGAIARPLNAADIDGSTLNLTFGDAVTALQAGTPYIIKWPAAVSFTYTATSGTGTGDGGYDKLVDGDTDSKWCNNSGPWTCEFNTSAPVYVTGYTLTTAADTHTYQNRNPRKWTLEAKVNEGDTWTTIDSRDVTANSKDALPTDDITESQVYAIASERLAAYQYFRFTVSQSGGIWMQLSELTLKQGSDIVNPVFRGVTIDATDRSYDNHESGDAQVRFLGTYKSTTFDAEDKSILLMGDNNTLYYPTTGAGIGAQRAYIKIGDDSAQARKINTFSINFGKGDNTTSIINVLDETSDNTDDWYQLDGRKLDGKPKLNGIYINKGKKVFIK